MDDKTFKREKVRRDLQEILNSIDASMASEDEKDQKEKDITWLLKLMAVNFEMATLVEDFLPKKENQEI